MIQRSIESWWNKRWKGRSIPSRLQRRREALESSRNYSDIVVTDWMMPDVSGVELCERIRRTELAYTYVILLTSISDKDMIVKGLAAGADDYLTKPFDPGELNARIGVGRRIICLQRDIEAKNLLLQEAARTTP